MSITIKQAGTDKLFAAKTVTMMFFITVGYFLLSWLLIGFKTEQVFLMTIVNGLYFLSLKTRKFIKGFSIFIIYWVIFDYMKAFPNYSISHVHIKDIYLAEKSLFGIRVGANMLTPNEYLRLSQTSTLNVITGLFYLCWIPVPLGLAAYLFFDNKRQFFYFSCTFLLVNCLGFIIYYCFPVAPPWYVQYSGFSFNPHTPGNVAGLGRFDTYFHTNIFSSLYAKSSNVFAAMPSLHSAYPVIVLYYGLKNKLGPINILFAFIMIGIWFSAIYNSHHYMLDVLCGILCAILGIFAFNYTISSNKWFFNILNKSIKSIS
ncbi:MAG: phosphatase PAP2 family protein [Flavipsychrobacter sp.]|nr:phosphatase PAP2 family protein [Flavipsychrobacter sp.]